MGDRRSVISNNLKIRVRYADIDAKKFVHSFLHAETGKPTRAPAMFLQIMQEAMNKSQETHA